MNELMPLAERVAALLKERVIALCASPRTCDGVLVAAAAAILAKPLPRVMPAKTASTPGCPASAPCPMPASPARPAPSPTAEPDAFSPLTGVPVALAAETPVAVPPPPP